MVIKSNDRLAHKTKNCKLLLIILNKQYFVHKLLMLTTSALRDYLCSVY